MKPVLAVIVAATVAVGPSARIAAARPAEGTVTSLSVAPTPTPGHAELVVAVTGNVKVSEFALSNPDRIVVDIDGATIGVAPGAYDHAPRGGLTDVRYSQFRKNTVRVVVYLDSQRDYKVWRTVGQVHVSVATDTAAKFASWQAGAGSPRVAATSGPARAESPATSKPAATTAAPAPAPSPAKALAAADRPAPAATQQSVADRPASMTDRPAPERAAEDRAPARLASQDEPAEPPMRAARATQQAQQRSAQPRITVTYQGSDIRDVLAAFAAFSGRTIIPSSSVPPTKVDAEIRDQPWDVALQSILSAQGLAATEDANGIIIVDTQERIAARQATEPLVSRIVRLNYQRATPVADQIRQRLQQCIPSPRAGVSQSSAAAAQTTSSLGGSCVGRGTVSADEITNAVSITAPSSVVDDLVAFAETLDIRQAQVNIKAKIVLVNRTDLDAFGIKYDLGSRDQFFSQVVQRADASGNLTNASDAPRVLLGGNTVSAIANAAGSVPSAALNLVYSTALGKFDFTTFLDALQQVGLLDVQAEPSLTILNNRTATLISGSEVPFVPITGAAGAALNTPIAVQRIQTGVTLTVTPSVTNNRQILMKVMTDNSGATFTPNGTLIDRNTSTSELLVPDGQTVVIGGLTQTTVNEVKTGIPLLVDLPVIGRLFGYTSRNETRRDLLILITPHIVDEGQQPTEAQRR